MPEAVPNYFTITETRRFIEALVPRGQVLTFQTFADEPETYEVARLMHGTLDEHLKDLRELNRRGAGIFLSLNETDGQGRKEENIKSVRAVCLDLDGSPLGPVRYCSLQPHIVVESSPHRFHVYWLVDGLPLEQFQGVQWAIARRFNGDPAIAKLTHCARLPGFDHRKNDPFRVRILEESDAEPYSAAQILAEFPPIAKPHKAPTSGGMHPTPKGAPLEAAKAFAKRYYERADGLNTAVAWRGDFYEWTGSHYARMRPADLDSRLYQFFDRHWVSTSNGKVEPFNPTRSKVSDVKHALLHGLNAGESKDAPFWLPPLNHLSAEGWIACKNGLLNVDTDEWQGPDPCFFTPTALPFDHDPEARCPRWRDFLHQLWPGEEGKQARLLLGEIFGYLLSGDTSLQKIMMLVGPKRSGKGTIARILTALLGGDAVANPTLASLGNEFGLWPLINRKLAIVTDARLGPRTDVHLVAERLLAISGEDNQTINRKYQSHWTGRLGTRFLLLSNELPAIRDVSGALPSRFVILTMTESFFGRENPKLAQELMVELPGILNWALDGLDRLRERGFFAVPQASIEAIQQLEDLASPVSAFIRDWCEVGPSKKEGTRVLYGAWKSYCELSGDKAGSDKMFGRNLRAALPSLTKRGRPPKQYYVGLQLNEYGLRKYESTL